MNARWWQIALLLILTFPLTSWADDVLPAVSAEEMSAYKNAFGKAVEESRPDNFGAKVSDAAKNMKGEILQNEKNFGSWVSKQRRSENAEKKEGNRNDNSMNARDNSPGGRPSGAGKPESAGKPNHEDHPNKGQGSEHGKGKN